MSQLYKQPASSRRTNFSVIYHESAMKYGDFEGKRGWFVSLFWHPVFKLGWSHSSLLALSGLDRGGSAGSWKIKSFRISLPTVDSCSWLNLPSFRVRVKDVECNSSFRQNPEASQLPNLHKCSRDQKTEMNTLYSCCTDALPCTRTHTLKVLFSLFSTDLWISSGLAGCSVVEVVTLQGFGVPDL